MISFPNCKINLGLRILHQRNDGYHNLISVFYPVQWCDALEFVEADAFSFEMEGLKIEGASENNFCVKAYRLLQKKYSVPPVKMMLLKNIPMGAGLGGGSSDAAFTLKMLNEYFDLKLSFSELKAYALQLGSDCPFFIENKPSLATGRGDELEQVKLDLSGLQVLIVYPDVEVNTAWAYHEHSKNINHKSDQNSIINFREQISNPVSTWKEFLVNDFEQVVVNRHPEIGMIKKQLYEAGAIYASMSGSGSAIYGIFNKEANFQFSTSCKSFKGRL